MEEDLTPYLCSNQLACLAAELALCLLYIEGDIGGFCDDCTCQLGYHTGLTQEECEVCGCYGKHTKLLMQIPLAKIPIKKRSPAQEATRYLLDEVPFNDYRRGKEARLVLKELTE